MSLIVQSSGSQLFTRSVGHSYCLCHCRNLTATITAADNIQISKSILLLCFSLGQVGSGGNAAVFIKVKLGQEVRSNAAICLFRSSWVRQ